MPTIQLRIVAAVVAVFFLCQVHTKLTKGQHSGTDTYAITNARIVTVSGPVIERGSVVVRDGLITAVGANVAVPPDARVIDGNGLNVYPGLIDANTSLGISEPAASSSPSASPVSPASQPSVVRSGTPPPGVPNAAYPAGLHPELMAEDLIRPGGDQIDLARNVGITTALTVPRSGIWIGQSALINLAGDTSQQMILRSPLAMHIGFTPLRGGIYPGSLMGVIASLRQMLLDAQRYREAQLIYERSPRGLRRLPPDRSLEALIPLLERKMPVVIYADREREILRALDLGEEFHLRVLIAGGSESWKLVDRLQKTGVPVLLSLNFPRRTTVAMPEADPEPLRILRDRVEAARTPAKLATAKVPFAFQSGFMTSIADFVPNVLKTIENGLAKEEALRALTLRPAEIVGVADRLGSIENGKIANLTITRGDLFDRNARVAYVFIDGRPVDLRPTPPPEPSRANATGTWTVNVDLGQGEVGVTLILQQEGERLRGTIQGALGSGEIANASVSKEGEIRFTVKLNVGGETVEATFQGNVAGQEMKGSVNITGRAPGSFTGTRPSSTAPPKIGMDLAANIRAMIRPSQDVHWDRGRPARCLLWIPSGKSEVLAVD